MRVILFGVSKVGENYVFNYLDIEVVVFMDNDSVKYGICFMGYFIIVFVDINIYDVDSIIIIS